MGNSNFDPSNIGSLPDPGYETRDHLSELAIAILSAKYDLSAEDDYMQLIRDLDQIIRDLHTAYDSMEPLATFD